MIQKILAKFGYYKVETRPVFPFFTKEDFGMTHGPELDGCCGNPKCSCNGV